MSADRVVFNIKGNSYRLMVAIDYEKGIVWIKWLGTHKDYDQIDATEVAEVKRLWGSRTCTPDGDRLDVLATLIDAYEALHEPMDRPDPIAAIQFRMEQQGLTRKDLEPLLETRTRVSEVLNRKRVLSIGMIRRLHAQLGIAADVLIRAPRPAKRNVSPRVTRSR